METINCVPLGFAPLCSSFQNPISSMSSRSTFIRALPLDYLPPLPQLPRCCMLQCIKLNEVSVQVTLAPASHAPPPAFTAGNQGRGPLPAGVVPARLHKLALMRAGETCSKGGSEGQKSGEKKQKRGNESCSVKLKTHQRLRFSVVLLSPFYTLLSILKPGLCFFPTDRFHEAPRSETVAA